MKIYQTTTRAEFILKVLFLLFTISNLLFPQYLSESQRNNLEAQLKRQAGRKTIILEFYAPYDSTAQAYGYYIGVWIARNGYELQKDTRDGAGNYKITLYKPSKEELEQRRIAEEKRAREARKRAEAEMLAKFDRNPKEGYRDYLKKNSSIDIEILKKYYYPYKEQLIKSGNTNAIAHSRFEFYDSGFSEELMLGLYKNPYLSSHDFINFMEFLDKEGEILWDEISIDNFIYIYSSEVDKLCYIIKKSPCYKFLTGDFSRLRLISKDKEDALKIYNAIVYQYEKYIENPQIVFDKFTNELKEKFTDEEQLKRELLKNINIVYRTNFNSYEEYLKYQSELAKKELEEFKISFEKWKRERENNIE